jgi:hypothetical protein
MRSVSNYNKLEFQKDVKKLTVGSPNKFLNYFEVNPNTTRYAIVWCTDSWKISDDYPISIPCQFEDDKQGDMIFYTIWTNKSLTPDFLFKPDMMPLPKDYNLMQLQVSVDNAILKHLHLKSGNPD